ADIDAEQAGGTAAPAALGGDSLWEYRRGLGRHRGSALGEGCGQVRDGRSTSGDDDLGVVAERNRPRRECVDGLAALVGRTRIRFRQPDAWEPEPARSG